MPTPALAAALADVSTEIDRQFDLFLALPDDPRRELYRAMRHAAIGGGKRLRPLLVFATAALFDVDRAHASRAATAIESVHVYSLIHDDLPAMDDDDMRRGKPTVHKAFTEATAILAGDCLHALAFEILAHPATHPDAIVRAELVFDLARAAGPSGMAGGQMMDIEAEKARFDLPTVTRLQQMKTGALITASVEAGAILGRVPADARTGLRGYAHDLGLAFQIADDLLDAEGDEAAVGKKLRKDGGAGKETFLTLMGAERARAQAAMLVEQAVEHLHGYGADADLLRDIAHFVFERDR
ncbi:polyprenyl synthetase family protein [Sphingomonas sp. CROZ-RG-20F-R02-07]|uniref:polyprenyl synthetase family protein n=1 Tax=Sphingomonas sp. CROZ-RG-20F-R02-07 TaxID=2914832 RepID=UPI001F5A6D47|nr:farnesyl diphosphate synthase [Sphingomonas sp. CROZ-RG-20F-R02-07]